MSFCADRLQIREKRDVKESSGECWVFEVWSNRRSSCVLVVQCPVCICLAAFPKAEAGALGWGSKSRQSILLAPLVVSCWYWEWWHWTFATTPCGTFKVGIVSVHPSSSPETCSRSGAEGDPGSRKRWISRTLLTFQSHWHLRFCEPVSVSGNKLVAGGQTLIYCNSRTAGSHSSEPSACTIFQTAVLCETLGMAAASNWTGWSKNYAHLRTDGWQFGAFLIFKTNYQQSQRSQPTDD